MKNQLTNDQKIQKSAMLSEVTVAYKTKLKRAEMPKITSSKDAYDYCMNIWNAEKIDHLEQCFIILMNRGNNVLGWALISSGGIAATVVDPKVVFQIALNSNASAFILAHNHPSGNTSASDADDRLTRNIKDGAKLLEISLLDHLIVTSENYFSYADEGKL